MPSRLRDYVLITLGCVIQALAMDLFLVPARLAAGGISGLAQIVHAFTGWPIGLMVAGLNVPLFFLGWRYLGGRRFMLRTVVTVAVYSALVDGLAAYLPKAGVTQDLFLNALYGGVLGGLGMGLVFRAQGTTGGTDVVARLLNHWRGVPLGQTILVVNAAVLILAVIAFGLEPAMYALILTFVGARVVDLVQGEADYSRTAIIVSSQAFAIKSAILAEMERGVTVLTGRGGYTEHSLDVLYCVVARTEVSILKRLISSIDPRAFVVITDASEVLGEGFREWR